MPNILRKLAKSIGRARGAKSIHRSKKVDIFVSWCFPNGKTGKWSKVAQPWAAINSYSQIGEHFGRALMSLIRV